MEERLAEIKKQMSALTLIHTALLAGQVIFLLLVFSFQYYGVSQVQSAELLPLFNILVPVISVAALVGSKMIFRTRIAAARQQTGLYEKLMLYKQASIIRYAMLEFSVLFAIVTFLLTADYFLLAFAVLMTMVFATARPGRYRVETDLELSGTEKAVLESAMN